MQWHCDKGGGRPAEVHPVDDTRPHVMEAVGGKCWCGAEANEDGTIVHNAADGREKYETGERKRS